jgi:voltage-gated potassium channel
MEFAITYLGYFTDHLLLAWPLLGFMALLIMTLGVIAGVSETWKPFDSIYWAFITATTVGYGDIRPKKRFSRCVSVLIALVGVTFTGIIVALAINAATLSFKEVHHVEIGSSPIDLGQ